MNESIPFKKAFDQLLLTVDAPGVDAVVLTAYQSYGTFVYHYVSDPLRVIWHHHDRYSRKHAYTFTSVKDMRHHFWNLLGESMGQVTVHMKNGSNHTLFDVTNIDRWDEYALR